MEKIIKTFKHFFIPHIHNDFKPKLFQEVSVVALFVGLIVLFSVSIGSRLYVIKTNMTATVLPAVLVDLTNQARTSEDKGTLVRSEILDAAAKLKAQNMADLGYFAHNSPTGVTPWYWFSKAGYSFIYAGENLAIDFTESVDVEKAWLNSPSHKANIMNNNFTEIGVATVDGIYNGKNTTYVVQMFGKPAFQIQATKAVVVKTKVESKNLESNPSRKLAVVPEVKGEFSQSEPKVEVVEESKDFISVKNIRAIEENINPVSLESSTPKYSTWRDRLVFLMPSYVDKIYRILIWVLLIDLALMVVVEIKKQHKKNIVYGLLLIVIIVCLIYLNKAIL